MNGTSGFQEVRSSISRQTQAVIRGHVQLLSSWFDQDTGFALEP
jgi:hypothetical protein